MKPFIIHGKTVTSGSEAVDALVSYYLDIAIRFRNTKHNALSEAYSGAAKAAIKVAQELRNQETLAAIDASEAKDSKETLAKGYKAADKKTARRLQNEIDKRKAHPTFCDCGHPHPEAACKTLGCH